MFRLEYTLLAHVKVTCSLSTYLIRQFPLNNHFLSVAHRREAHLILELYLHFSNVAFHYFTYDLICVQVSEVDHLGTSVPFIMVPLLYPVSNALQHSSSDACFSSQPTRNLALQTKERLPPAFWLPSAATIRRK